jgi:hypothetical protein
LNLRLYLIITRKYRDFRPFFIDKEIFLIEKKKIEKFSYGVNII